MFTLPRLHPLIRYVIWQISQWKLSVCKICRIYTVSAALKIKWFSKFRDSCCFLYMDVGLEFLEEFYWYWACKCSTIIRQQLLNKKFTVRKLEVSNLLLSLASAVSLVFGPLKNTWPNICSFSDCFCALECSFRLGEGLVFWVGDIFCTVIWHECINTKGPLSHKVVIFSKTPFSIFIKFRQSMEAVSQNGTV
jgi:hypothetical protein